MNIHIFGGVSDAIALCKALEQLIGHDQSLPPITYSLSVVTSTGADMAADLQGRILVKRMDRAQMQDYFIEAAIDIVIDASHPYAVQVTNNVVAVCQQMTLPLIRYERPAQGELAAHPLLFKVADVVSACALAARFGPCVLLTTGSKQLAEYIAYLPEKRIVARVLPTPEVIASCYQLGLSVNDIVALKGPFSFEMNTALYNHIKPDVMITKEAGIEGGFFNKVHSCLALDIPCIVIERPITTPMTSNTPHVAVVDSINQALIVLTQKIKEISC